MFIFLTACKETIGHTLHDAVLMTDDTDVYHNAWCRVMGQPRYRLLCTWHIDRAWRKNLVKVRGDSMLKATVYKTLRALMEIQDSELFEQKVSEFLQCAKDDERTSDFAAYFDKHYVSRPHTWAYCFRLGLQVQTFNNQYTFILRC